MSILHWLQWWWQCRCCQLVRLLNLRMLSLGKDHLDYWLLLLQLETFFFQTFSLYFRETLPK